MKVLLVDDQPEVLGFLTDVLASHGYEPLPAGNGEEALEVYREHRPPFTLTDISMPVMNGIELLKQIKAITPEAVVMLMTGAGSESYAVEALRLGAVNYFNKPVDFNDILNTLSRYSSLASGYDFELYAADILVEERLELELKNDIGLVNQAVQMILNHCRAIFPLSELFTLRFGLYEMMVNAIEHGNLGITYEEKSDALERSALSELIAERTADPDRAARRVRVQCAINATGLYCRIEDEGDGFDHSSYSQVEDAGAMFERLGASLHGRGIILTSLQFDEVEFNAKGNQVTIRKHVPVEQPVAG